jgi:hypothetical protein
MSAPDIQTVYNNLEVFLKKEWMDRPDEIKQLEARKGAWNQTLAVHLHCHSETLELVELLWLVRLSIKKGRLSLEAAKSFLGPALMEKGDKMNRYYKIKELPDLLNQVGAVLPRASSMEEFIKVLDPLLLYIGRYNYWLDADIDWKTLSEKHEKLREKQR